MKELGADVDGEPLAVVVDHVRITVTADLRPRLEQVDVVGAGEKVRRSDAACTRADDRDLMSTRTRLGASGGARRRGSGGPLEHRAGPGRREGERALQGIAAGERRPRAQAFAHGTAVYAPERRSPWPAGRRTAREPRGPSPEQNPVASGCSADAGSTRSGFTAAARRTHRSHGPGCAGRPGSAAWPVARPRRPASRTPGRSRRRGSSGPPPP